MSTGTKKLMIPVFLLTYVSLVLPFTVLFVGEFAHIDSDTQVIGVPVNAIVPLTLPAFLAALEIAGFFIACSFWRSAGRSRSTAALAAVLFVAIQAVPVTAAFITMEKNAHAQHLKTLADERAVVNAEKETHQTASAEMLRLRSEDVGRLESARTRIADDLRQMQGRQRQLQSAISGGWAQDGADVEVRQLTAQIDGAMTEVRETDAALRRLNDRASIIQDAETSRPRDSVPPDPPFASYLAATLWSTKTAMSALVALMFPLSMLAVSFVVTHDGRDRSQSGMDLARRLDAAASMPTASQVDLANLMKPVVGAHLAAHRATEELSKQVVIYQLETDHAVRRAEEISRVKADTLSSTIAPVAKQDLIRYVDSIEGHEVTNHQEAV